MGSVIGTEGLKCLRKLVGGVGVGGLSLEKEERPHIVFQKHQPVPLWFSMLAELGEHPGQE